MRSPWTLPGRDRVACAARVSGEGGRNDAKLELSADLSYLTVAEVGGVQEAEQVLGVGAPLLGARGSRLCPGLYLRQQSQGRGAGQSLSQPLHETAQAEHVGAASLLQFGGDIRGRRRRP